MLPRAVVADEPGGLFDRYPSQRVPWSRPATPVQLKHGLTQVGRSLDCLLRMKSRVGRCW
jgi:hypothetical protein